MAEGQPVVRRHVPGAETGAAERRFHDRALLRQPAEIARVRQSLIDGLGSGIDVQRKRFGADRLFP